MEHHLRLAEARGSLVAPNSPVQDRALALLLVHHRVEQARRDTDSLKRTLMGIPVDQVSDVLRRFFPEYLPEADPFEKAKREDGTYDIDAIDPSEIKWSVPDPDTDAEISAWIAAAERGSMSAADLDNDGWK